MTGDKTIIWVNAINKVRGRDPKNEIVRRKYEDCISVVRR